MWGRLVESVFTNATMPRGPGTRLGLAGSRSSEGPPSNARLPGRAALVETTCHAHDAVADVSGLARHEHAGAPTTKANAAVSTRSFIVRPSLLSPRGSGRPDEAESTW